MHIYALRDRAPRRERAFAALLLAMLIAQLETNIVVTALPLIGQDLGGGVAAVMAAPLLAITVATPLHGRCGDALGRRTMFRASIVTFATGSIACALAPTMATLVAARVVQGTGGAGLVVVAISSLAELFSREELIRRQLWLTGAFALSSVAGPPLGGWIASLAGWRAVFLITAPICLLAFALGARTLPGAPSERQPLQLDVRGAALLALAGAAVTLLGSVPALARSPLWLPLLALTALVALVALPRVERHAAAPLIAPRLLADPALARTIAVTALSGIALFGTFTFVPFAIAATGAGTGATGLLLLPLTVGQLVVVASFALLARRFPHVTAWGRLGLVVGAAGMLALAAVPHLPGAAETPVLVAALALTGAAFGLTMQAYTLVAQTHAPRDAIGATIGALGFARQLGGSLGVATFGWIVLASGDPGDASGLTAVFAVAALALAVAIPLAPRRTHEEGAERA